MTTPLLDEVRQARLERQAKYGHPSKNHGCTAQLMRAWLERRYGAASFDAIDVCAFNILQKMSRLAETPDHHDSHIDICGWTDNWDVILRFPPEGEGG